MLWQAFLADCYSIPLRTPARLVLALTVWAIYLGDRLLDARQPPEYLEAARHRFHRRWWRPLSFLLVAILAADALIAFHWLRPAVIHNGVLAMLGVIAYLSFLHLRGVKLPKEIIVAALFTAGTFIVGLTNTGDPSHLLLPASAFFALCLGNLLTIEDWERIDLRNLPPLVGYSMPVVMAILAILCLLIGSRWHQAIAVSSLLIAALYAATNKIEYELRRVLVDAALLTPLFWLAAGR